jgi:multiple sugar transport system substrate-binding protein
VPAGGTYSTVLGGWAFVANSKGKNPAAAAQFVTWALGSMNQDSVRRMADWCVKAKSDIAPRQSALTLAEQEGGYDNPYLKYFKEQVFPGGRGEPRFPPPVYTAISNAIQAVELGGVSATTQASKTQAIISSYLASYTGAPLR